MTVHALEAFYTTTCFNNTALILLKTGFSFTQRRRFYSTKTQAFVSLRLSLWCKLCRRHPLWKQWHHRHNTHAQTTALQKRGYAHWAQRRLSFSFCQGGKAVNIFYKALTLTLCVPSESHYYTLLFSNIQILKGWVAFDKVMTTHSRIFWL